MLTARQSALADLPLERRVFLEGPAGSGKTSAAVGRLQRLLASGVSGRNVLVIVPQRTLAGPFEAALAGPEPVAGGEVTVVTFGGLAQRMVDLFWPLAGEAACFAAPDLAPTFLTLETAQYYMARLVRPLLEQGYFETITIERNRIYSQILDNLNKAAVVGFPHTEMAARLKAAWIGDKSQLRVYDEAQDCATRFREYCLAHNLLDFSLQYEVFVRHLWPCPECRDYLLSRYTHLIVDNLEEDTAVAHDLLREWLPACRSALLVYDWDAGYRRFLGADPGSTHTLVDLCSQKVAFEDPFVTSAELRALGAQLARSFSRKPAFLPPESPKPASHFDVRSAIAFEYHRYYPQMVEWVAGEIARLVDEEGVLPGQIAILSPFLSDALRFLLTNALERRGVPARSHRPSRALRDEPAAQCLLTLAALGHPQWRVCPRGADVAQALGFAIAGLDPVRAQLLVLSLYRGHEGAPYLNAFEGLPPDAQERVTYLLGGRYERLRGWLAGYAGGEPAELDHFLSRLFGEVLSQPGFGYHHGFDAGEVAANLIESVRKFRWVTAGRGGVRARSQAGEGPASGPTLPTLGQEYVQMVDDGVVAAQYVRSWQLQPADAVLLAPAYTFLMANRPVDYQFWLDVGSPGWWERLNQPLTQPYVLSRAWPPGALWGDRQEFDARQEALRSLVLGLTRRCRRKIYLALSELSQDGSEQQGPLLRAIQQVLRRAPE